MIICVRYFQVAHFQQIKCKRESEWDIQWCLNEIYNVFVQCITVMINVIMIFIFLIDNYGHRLYWLTDWIIQIDVMPSNAMDISVVTNALYYVRIGFARDTHRTWIIWHVQLTQILIAINDCAMKRISFFRLSSARFQQEQDLFVFLQFGNFFVRLVFFDLCKRRISSKLVMNCLRQRH